MARFITVAAFVCLFTLCAKAQVPEARFVADTLVVEAEGSFETDPDLGTLKFDISAQDKEVKAAYDKARQSAQRVVDLAEKNGLKKEDVTLGILTLTPSYDHDRKNKPKSYTVHGQITLRVRELSTLGPILDGAVEEGVVEFRSMTYSLQDEEAAKERAVAAAMHSAVGRASSALAQSGQKLGAVRYANVDVKQLVGVTQVQQLASAAQLNEVVEVTAGGGSGTTSRMPPPPPFPAMTPDKITVSATVQCAFQIQ